MGSLLTIQNVLHVWNDFTLGVAQKTNCCVGRLIWVFEFSKESFEGVFVILATRAVPKRIVFPELFDLFHKMGVFFPFLRINDCKG